MRAAGMQYEAIGAELGITKQSAHAIVRRALRMQDRAHVRELRSVWYARLDADFEALDERANAGDKEAIAVRVRIVDRVARLMGLDEPTRTDVTSDGAPLAIILDR